MKIYKVNSRTSEKIYSVTKKEDNSYTCTCDQFLFRGSKTPFGDCPHIRQVIDEGISRKLPTRGVDLKFKINTQKGLILDTMMAQKERWFLASDFCGGDDKCPFIGYKAPTRIAEMQKTGLIVSRWAERTTALGDRLKEYTLNTHYFMFAYNVDEVVVDKRGTNNGQRSLL